MKRMSSGLELSLAPLAPSERLLRPLRATGGASAGMLAMNFSGLESN